MQKLSTKVIEKMIQSNLSSLEIDFLLAIGICQDDTGRVEGVYYRDVVAELGCSNQQFYNILHSLSDKGLIRIEKASYYDYDVTILDNDFTAEQYRKGYVSLSKGLFRKEFRELKAGEKLLAIELFREQDIRFHKIDRAIHSASLIFNRSTLVEKFCKLLGVTVRVLCKYLRSLKAFFSIGRKDGKYYITPLKSTYEDTAQTPSDQQLLNENTVKSVCRRNRIDAANVPGALKDTAELITQYAFQAKEAGMEIVDAVTHAILRSVDASKQAFVAKERRLEPKLVHLLLIRALGAGMEQKLAYKLSPADEAELNNIF